MPSIQVESWNLTASMWDSKHISGLVPTLFAESVAAATEALMSSPGKAHGDVAKINKAVFIPEELSLVEAVAFLKKPREGAVIYPFKGTKYQEPKTISGPGPSSKRQRTEESGTDSGA